MPRLDTKKLTRFRAQPGTPHEVRYNCPHCGDLNGKLWANFKKGVWTCFKCNESGTILPRDATTVVDAGPAFKGEPIRRFEWATWHDIRGTGKRYLRTHNIPLEVALQWGVRSGKGDAEGRLVIPVKYMTRSGYRVLFRVAHASSSVVFPKELQSGDRMPWVLSWNQRRPHFPTLPNHGTDLVGRTAVIVEGAADAMRMSAAALLDDKIREWVSIVCLWGKNLAEHTAFDLVRMFDNFYILLDREESLTKSGERVAGMKIHNKLAAIATGMVVRHTWDKKRKSALEGLANDPAELTDDQAVKLLHRALYRTGG